MRSKIKRIFECHRHSSSYMHQMVSSEHDRNYKIETAIEESVWLQKYLIHYPSVIYRVVQYNNTPGARVQSKNHITKPEASNR
jgi:hypothetical protein